LRNLLGEADFFRPEMGVGCVLQASGVCSLELTLSLFFCLGERCGFFLESGVFLCSHSLLWFFANVLISFSRGRSLLFLLRAITRAVARFLRGVDGTSRLFPPFFDMESTFRLSFRGLVSTRKGLSCRPGSLL